MAVAFDLLTDNGGGNSATPSFAHVTSGLNTYLIVCVWIVGGSVSSMTYNSVALAQLGAATESGDNWTIEVWGLKNPTTGSNTVAITLSGAVTNRCTASNFTGVDQTTPTGTAVSDVYAGFDAGHAHDTTSQTDGMVWDAIICRNSGAGVVNFAINAGQASRVNVDTTFRMAGTTKPGAATVNTGYTWDSAFSHWAHVTVPLKPVTDSWVPPPLASLPRAYWPTIVPVP